MRAAAIGLTAALSATLHYEFHGQGGPKAENFPVTRSLALSATQSDHRPTTSARNAVDLPSDEGKLAARMLPKVPSRDASARRPAAYLPVSP